MTREDELERLLDEAREASPTERLPTYRDAIAAFGQEAIEPLATWIDEPAFAAFAIRTLGRIASTQQDARQAVVAALAAADRSTMPDHIARDLDSALDQLGLSPARRAAAARASAAGRATSARPILSPGVDGRGYWAMRTSPWERPYIWAEAQRGLLRQGWGWSVEQDLEVIALAIRAGQPLSDEQQMAWPSRRLMSSEPDGMRPGDLILVPNIPEWGLVCFFRLVGSYEYAPDAPRRFDDRFGHILPVELIAGPISRYDSTVSDALQSSMRNPGRLWNIAPYGGDVERLTASEGGNPTGNLQDAADSLLTAIGEWAETIGDGPLTLHWPLVGSQFDGGVLVIGQAVYGWYGDWTAPQARDAAQRQHIINEARDLFADRPDRMDWIDGHRVWNSPFWRVARDVTDAVAPGPGPFYGRMAWANLYPVGPNDAKSNPRGALLKAQTEAAATFVAATIASLQPRLVLVVGGPYIWPFVEPLGLGTLNSADRPLYLSGQRDGIDWIVGMHPGGASRHGWGPSRYAGLIVDTRRALPGT